MSVTHGNAVGEGKFLACCQPVEIFRTGVETPVDLRALEQVGIGGRRSQHVQKDSCVDIGLQQASFYSGDRHRIHVDRHHVGRIHIVERQTTGCGERSISFCQPD